MLKPIDIVVLTELVLRPPDQVWTQSELAQKLHLDPRRKGLAGRGFPGACP